MHSVQYKRGISVNRSDMSSRYQCTRLKKGYQPIRIRVICNSGVEEEGDNESITTECQPCLPTIVKSIKSQRCPDKQSEVSAKKMRYELLVEHLEERKKMDVLVEQLEERKKMDVSNEKALKEKELEILILEKEKHVLKTELAEKESFILKEKLDPTERKLEKENLFLKGKLDSTERKLKSAQVLANHYKKQNAVKEMYQLKKTEGVLDKNIDPMKYLCTSIEKLLGTVLPGKHAHEKASLLIAALSSSKLLKGEGLKVLNELNRQHIRLVFKEWKLLKAFDCSSVGAFKTSTLQAMHAILDEDKKGYFPSVSSVTRCRHLLDNHGKNLVGYERKETKYGEVYFLNFDKAIRLLLKATGLYEKAQKVGVAIAFTADGAALMKSRTHVSCGVKITDVDGYHPLTRMPLTTINEEDDADGTRFNMVQSRELCTILVMADAKDSKELYDDVFKEFYEYSEQLRQFGMEEKDGEPALKPFLVTHTPRYEICSDSF